MAALCIPAGLALAQTSTDQLPAGTRLDFVADDSVNATTAHPGGRFRVHLLHDLVLNGSALAPAGTAATLLVTEGARHDADGPPQMTVTLVEFRLPAGELPVAPLTASVTGITAGSAIPAQTMGSVERTGGRVVIHVPVPVPLPSDALNAAFTPFPARTVEPLLPRPRRSAPPLPSPSPSPSPAPSP